MTQPDQLWRRFQEPDDRGLVDDVCQEVRLITEQGAGDPGKTIALAIAGAEAAEGLASALEDEWALYTPEQAAVTASALFAQIAAAGTALEKLDAYLDVMADRGDIAAPEYDGEAEAGRLCTAQSTLGAAGQEALGAVEARDCTTTVDILASTPYLGPLPANSHQTLTATAELLGDHAQLHPYAHFQDPADLTELDRKGDGCGCRIELTAPDGTTWYFHRMDSSWCFTPSTNNQHPLRPDLLMTEARAHPQHLAMLVQQALTTTD